MTNVWRVWTPGQPLVKKGSGSLSSPVFEELDRCDALVKACHKNDVGEVERLLKDGVCPDIMIWGTEASLLAHTLGRKRFEAAQLLLDAGANPMFPHSCHDEFIMEVTNSDMAHRLSEATHALERCRVGRNWKWVKKLLDHVPSHEPVSGVPEEDDRVLQEWKTLGVGLVSRRAPADTIERYLKKMEEMGISPHYKEMFVSLVSQARPVLKVFESIFSDYQGKTGFGRGADREGALFQAVSETLRESNGLEFTASGSFPGSSAPLQGIGLGWMISRWVQVHGPEGALVEWAKDAASQGQARLLKKTLLPLLGKERSGHGLLDDLVLRALVMGRRSEEVFRTLEEHWGPGQVDESLRRLDEGSGEAWKSWLKGRPLSLTSDGGFFAAARRLERAGVRVPQRSDRSFLEDSFSIGVAIVSVFSGSEGRMLVDLLVRCGADPFQPNLQNKEPLDILEEAHEKWGKLDHIRSHLGSMKMQAQISQAPPASPRRPTRF